MKTSNKFVIILLSAILLSACQKKIEKNQINLYAHQPVLPVLAKKERNKVLKIKLDVMDSTVVQNVTSFNFSLDGSSDIKDIEKASLLYSKTGKFEERTFMNGLQNES